MSRLPLTTSYWPADTSSPVLETTVGGVLRAAAERAPGQTALVAGDPDPARRRQWRFGELLAEAERAAHSLRARFAPGEPVAVWAGTRDLPRRRVSRQLAARDPGRSARSAARAARGDPAQRVGSLLRIG
ncbi:MAG: hypothetical protein ACM3ML_05000 [Micromonosporaceae bacterium]